MQSRNIVGQASSMFTPQLVLVIRSPDTEFLFGAWQQLLVAWLALRFRCVLHGRVFSPFGASPSESHELAAEAASLPTPLLPRRLLARLRWRVC